MQPTIFPIGSLINPPIFRYDVIGYILQISLTKKEYCIIDNTLADHVQYEIMFKEAEYYSDIFV